MTYSDCLLSYYILRAEICKGVLLSYMHTSSCTCLRKKNKHYYLPFSDSSSDNAFNQPYAGAVNDFYETEAGKGIGGLQGWQAVLQSLLQRIPATDHLQSQMGNSTLQGKVLLFHHCRFPCDFFETFPLLQQSYCFCALYSNWENHSNAFPIWELHNWETLIYPHIVLLGMFPFSFLISTLPYISSSPALKNICHN